MNSPYGGCIRCDAPYAVPMVTPCSRSSRPVVESSSLEDYLEAILVLSEEAGTAVRVTDLSEKLGVTKPSVSAAVKRLSDAGLVRHQKYGDVKLTASGREQAKDVASRHDLMLRFLKDVLGVEESLAERDACRLEHGLSAETVKCLARFVELLTVNAPERKTGLWKYNECLAKGMHHADLVDGR